LGAQVSQARFLDAIYITRWRLRRVFEIAIEAGIIYGNPAAKLERVPVTCETTDAASRAGVFAARWKRWSAPERGVRATAPIFCAGWRSPDAKERSGGNQWRRRLDFATVKFVVRGDAYNGTKNWSVRRVR